MPSDAGTPRARTTPGCHSTKPSAAAEQSTTILLLRPKLIDRAHCTVFEEKFQPAKLGRSPPPRQPSPFGRNDSVAFCRGKTRNGNLCSFWPIRMAAQLRRQTVRQSRGGQKIPPLLGLRTKSRWKWNLFSAGVTANFLSN